MRWTKRGIHGRLQVRIKVLNEDWRDIFSRWYPNMPSCGADNLTDKAIALPPRAIASKRNSVKLKNSQRFL